MKNKILLLSLNKAFKSLDKINNLNDKVVSFKYVLNKSTSMLKFVNARLENMVNKTEKKIKREKDKIKLNEKIHKFMNNNINFVNEHLKEEFEIFQNEFRKLKINLED